MTRLPRRLRTSRLLAGLARWAIKGLAWTWRLELVTPDYRQQAKLRWGSLILVMWHDELLPLVWHFRGQRVKPLISQHADGDLVSGFVESLGYRPIRGSSTRGGATAMLEILRSLRANADVAITPDGPRGPRHISAPGYLFAALKSGKPVVPVRVSASRAWRLGTWDRLIIPKPGSVVRIAYGPPVLVDAAAFDLDRILEKALPPECGMSPAAGLAEE